MEPRQVVHKEKQKGFRFNSIIWLFFVIALVATCWIGYVKLVPSFEQNSTTYPFEHPIYYEGKLQASGAVIVDEHVKLPLPLLETILIDSPIYYEQESNTLVLTTVDKVLRFETESLNALLNEKSYELTLTADVVDDTVYIPSEIIEQLYGFHIEYSASTGIVMVYKGNDAVDTVTITNEKGTHLRESATIKSPYYKVIESGQQLMVWERQEGWLRVQTLDGVEGFVKASHTIEGSPIVYASDVDEYKGIDHDLAGQKINLTWEAIYNRQPNLAEMPAMEGVNVVSPTWFELVDDTGKIQGKATHEYIEWAHARGYQVWALFSNGFEPDQTSEVLASAEKRFFMIQQLIAFAQLYQLEGINIDFENVYTKDKENLVQFIKELTPIMHEQGLVVSIDVTPKSTSEMWSVFLDREALGKIVDYMIVMAYDEHWAASPKSGSVASLPWVEKSISRIIDEDGVPPEKLILAMPLYTRIWSETIQEDGSLKVSSKAIGMKRSDEIIAEQSLKPQLDEASGQHYIEYVEEGVTQRIWLEDELSIASRVDLVHQYKLAGVATWARSFQKPEIWPVIQKSLFE
ncbi:MAG TPA: glycosyl hydrolase [Candidatus Paenibacillus intestinavium]|nr:glycosyl hydrolase [Candidatus Paenibacillus intestinavium]